MSEEEEKFVCKICHKSRPVSSNCGGDCVYCMAELGDPECQKRVEEECRENGGYRSIDSVVVSHPAISKPDVESTTEECDKCSRLVWVSHGTRADAEKTAKEDGGNVVYLCMSCVPEAIMGAELRIGGGQKDEMRLAGIDVEEIMKKTEMTLEEIGKMMLRVGRTLDTENKKRREL